VKGHISEIIPDLDKLPEWAIKAFEEGQYFTVVAKRIAELEHVLAKMDDLGELLVEWHEHDYSHEDGNTAVSRCAEAVDEIIGRIETL